MFFLRGGSLATFRSTEKYDPLETLIRNITLTCLLGTLLQFAMARAEVDSLVAKLDTVQSVESELTVLHEIIQKYTYSNPRLSDSVARVGLRLARKAENRYWESVMLYEAGISLATRGIYGAALRHFDEAKEIFEIETASTPESRIKVAYAWNQIGIVYHDKAEYARSLEAYQASLEIKKEFRELDAERYAGTTATTYSNIGMVYKDLGLIREALDHFKLSEGIYDQYPAQEGEILARNKAIVYGNLLEVYLEMGDLKEAEVYHRKSYHLNQLLRDPAAMVEYFDNEGDIAVAKEDWDRAAVAYNKALTQCRKAGNQFEQAVLYYKIGNLYLERKQMELAKEQYIKGQLIALDIGAAQLVADSYRYLSGWYEANGKLTEALLSYKKCVKAEAEIFNDRTVNALKEVTTLWSPERADDQVKLLSLEKELQDRRIEYSQIQTLAVWIILLMVLILFVVLFRSFRQKQTANQLLATKNEELQTALNRLRVTVAQLQQSETDLRAANTAKSKLFSVISHDLRGQLGGILTFASFLKERAGVFSPDQLSRFTDEFYRSAANMFELFENLLSWSTSQMNQPISCRIQMREAIRENLRIHTVQAQAKYVRLVSNCDEDLYGFADKNILHFLLRNLISNAIKFSQMDGEVCVTAYRVPNGVKVSVADRGLGMSPELKNSLFKPGEHPSTIGTNKEKGAGLGLLLCHEFVQKMGSNFEVESNLGQGTTISFILKDLLLETPLIEVRSESTESTRAVYEPG